MSLLTASTRSVFSNSTASVSEHVDLELVNRIIERAPRSATTFPLILRAYNEVLEDHGITPSADTAYYGFLLKVGNIRAATWGERWDLWRAAHKPVKPTYSPPSPTRQSIRIPHLSDVKSRLPFLASASSDLDEGFLPDTSDTGGDQSFIKSIRPSPRKILARDYAKSRSLVGYTPSQSIDYDTITLDPPVRTSTPVHAQEGRISPALPPYSASDISVELDVTGASSEFFTQTGYEDRAQTPKPQPKRQERVLSQALVNALEQRADHFYHTGLLGRCLDVWVQAHDWVQETNRKIDQARDRVLLRQMLIGWRRELNYRLSLPNTAEAHRNQHLKRKYLDLWITRWKNADLARKQQQFMAIQRARILEKTWATWNLKFIRQRRARLERYLLHQEKTFVLRKNRAMLNQVLTIWRGKTRTLINTRAADQLYVRKTLHIALGQWHKQTMLKTELAYFRENTERKLVSDSFSLWRLKSNLARPERVTSARKDKSLLRHALQGWRLRSEQIHQADQFASRSLFSKWRRKLQHVRSLQLRANKLSRHRDTTLIRRLFTQWAVAGRGELLQRVTERRLLRRSVLRWEARLDDVSRLDHQVAQFRGEQNYKTIHRIFSRWRDQCGRQQNRVLQADLLLNIKDDRLLSKSLVKWRDQGTKVIDDQKKADKAYAFFCLSSAWDKWRMKLRLKRQAEMVRRRQMKELKDAFDAWRAWSTYTSGSEAAVTVFREFQDRNLKKRVLHQWAENFMHVQMRELEQVEKRDMRLMHQALDKWRTQFKRVQDATDLMHTFMDLKAEDSLRRVLRRWHQVASASQSRRLALEELEQQRETSLLKNALSIWHGKWKESTLREVEEEVVMRHEDAIMFSVWDKWKGRCSQLPAVIFRNKHLKLRVWIQWREELQWINKEKDSSYPRDRKLIEEAFDIWRDEFLRKAAKSTRIRRSRPSTKQIEDYPRRITSNPSIPNRSLTTSSPRLSDFTNERFATKVNMPIRPGKNISGHVRSSSQKGKPGQEERISSSQSVISEPAYSRLRSELGRRRSEVGVGVDENVEIDIEEKQGQGGEKNGGSDLLRALRGTLGR
ncbi:hypothetical protein M231_05755 [Tremella mesenterica]|uniref:Sfi1 spindle body domain-containing protein n=1 Tax=Tremella mesenterica TaxID=5217 RepID=A0A4Q1BHB8_TREME|nr:hypothetical protein M231_05755 [Tremella mesenterica]